jgi:eukaryotic-like serine/threonine-protein kinase
LEKDPRLRYQHAVEIRADLQRLKRETTSGHTAQVTSGVQEASATGRPSGSGTQTAGGASSDTQIAVGLLARHKKKLLAVGAVTVLAILGVAYGVQRSMGASGASIDALAVLPFTNASGEANADYLSEGLSESLIGSLSRLPNLTVRPRSAVARYKAKEVDLQKTAEELKVNGLVTGRVAQRGDALEVVDGRAHEPEFVERAVQPESGGRAGGGEGNCRGGLGAAAGTLEWGGKGGGPQGGDHQSGGVRAIPEGALPVG